MIKLGDIAMMLAHPGVLDISIGLLKLRSAFDGQVRFMSPYREKKRLIGKELLGHSSLASTQVYTHNSLEQLKKVYKQAHPRSTKK